MDVLKAVEVEVSPEVAFKIYVEEIDLWWPRQGAQFRYTFAGPGRGPDRILFEPEEGGRFYEIFDDGTTYDIGEIVVFDSSGRLVYTWKAPDWPGATTIEVTFSARGAGTLVEVRHTGFDEAGVPEMAAGYGFGHEEILGVYAGYLQGH